MKLFIVLSLIACGYAAQLDRTYLPPSGAATAGGSPGSLNAPVGPSGSAGFSQPGANSGFGQPAANTGFGQPAAFGQSSGPSFGKSTSGPAFGSQPSGFAPSSQYGQPGSPSDTLDPGFSQVAQNFGSGAQNYQRNQPQRAQASADQNAEILRSGNQNDGETFSYSFETSNGIAAEESGVATNGVQAQGAFSYSDDDGQNFRVTYTADENGYQPQGDHLPTPHPIPEDILKSIEKNAQAAAAGTQEGAYNPNEDNSGGAPQQYNYNAPNTYSQGPSGSGSLNQQGSAPSQLYGAPNAGAGSRPQSGAQGAQPQGPSQQYGAPNGAGFGRPSNGFGQPQQGPSQNYGSPANGISGANSASQARPNSFGQNQFQPQGQSQQYGSPSRPGATGGSNGVGPSEFAPSGPASQSRPSQYQASQSRFPATGSPQGPAQSGQVQADSGYQYNRPQGSFGQASNGRPSNQGPVGNQGPAGAQGSAGNQGPAGQYRPQNGGAQTPSSQGSFPRPNSGNAGYPSGPAQGSFGPSSGSGSQGSYGSASSPNTGAFGPSSGPKGPSSFGPSTGSAGQGSFGPSAQGPSSFGPAAQGPSSFGPAAQGPNSFGPSGSNGQSSFGPSSGNTGFGRPQGSLAGTKGSMADSGYSYDRPGTQTGAGPGSQGRAGSQPQGGSNAPGSSNFGSPRQPPSFSEEEGYKY